MTYEEKRDRIIEVLAAAKADKPIEILTRSGFFARLAGCVNIVHLCDKPDQYRVTKEPVTRPWRNTEDLPKCGVIWVRGKGDYREHLVIGIANPTSLITASCGCEPIVYSMEFHGGTDWSMMEWSKDRHVWTDCTVTEEAQ